MAVSSEFQHRLNDLVNDCGDERSVIARKSGVSIGTLTYALAYGIIPSTKTLIKLANFFDVSLSYILGDTNVNEFVKADTPSTFQTRFEELCTEHGLTHYKVSQDCFFDKSIIPRWLSKGYIPELDILKQLVKEFDVSIDYLLGRTEYRK